MKTMLLKAELRTGLGKEAVKKVRKQKQIPAVAYGTDIKSTPITVSLDAFNQVVHTKAGENVVIDLTVEGLKDFKKTVVIKEVQHHPVTDLIVHVDFHTISLTEKIKVKVPVKTKGDALGVKEGETTAKFLSRFF